MDTYRFTLPPKKPGVYAFRHGPTQQVYIGSTTNLHRRFQEWRSVINSGSYWKSSVLADALAATSPDDWEFIVLIAYDTPEQALEMEDRLVERMKIGAPALLLNTREPRQNAKPAAVALSRITDKDGKSYTYREAADAIGCARKTIEKRLIRMRNRGIYSTTLEVLQSPTIGRPRKA